MKIAVLWTHLSGYLDACLRALAARPGVELFVAYQLPSDEAPFDAQRYGWISDAFAYRGTADAALTARLRAFGPNAMLVNSWHIAPYRHALARVAAGTLRILAMDNQWRGTAKQWLGVGAARWYIHRLYDRVFLPGERQAEFARRLGFRERQIWRGLYCCDQASFAAVFTRRGRATPHRFVYAGRLAAEKGLEILVDGYRRYRASAPNPWPLTVCGTGPMTALLGGETGVEMAGFVQPDQLPTRFTEAACLVLPSRFEPWGLVIHEATSAGLAVICSNACGAAVHLVQDGFNGYVVETGSAEELARAMLRYHALSDERRQEMAAASHGLSLQYTPARWAADFETRVAEAL